MISLGFFNTNGTPDEGVTFFRAVKNFVVQFGIHGDPSVGKEWREHKIEDDPVADQSNLEGYLTFATAGARSGGAALRDTAHARERQLIPRPPPRFVQARALARHSYSSTFRTTASLTRRGFHPLERWAV